MNFKKALFLFLALLLPIAVFLFLKKFGKNEFEVHPLFQESVTKPADCVGFEYEAPYVVNEGELSKLSWSKNDSLTLIVFSAAEKDLQKTISNQVSRLHTAFPGEKVNVISSADAVLKNCIFLLASTDNVVLVDARKRICGQYNLTDIDDADRLIMEMKIILKKY